MKSLINILALSMVLLFTSACSQIARHPVSHHSVQPSIEKNRSLSQQQTSSNAQVVQAGQKKRQPVNQNPIRNKMVLIAKSTIGVPYRWGGNNPREGFDCSGLIRYVHKQATGMNIPRTAARQRDSSKTISYNQLQPGDMLFFKTGKRSNHVGIYVGNRQFVHAPSGGKRVKITSMDSSYWYKRFVKFGTYL